MNFFLCIATHGGGAFWFPWCPFMIKILRIPSAAADTTTSRTIERNVDGRRLRLKSGACSCETPYCIGGKRRYFVFLHNRLEISCAKSASVDTGKCAPCCSMDTNMGLRLCVLARVEKLEIASKHPDMGQILDGLVNQKTCASAWKLPPSLRLQKDPSLLICQNLKSIYHRQHYSIQSQKQNTDLLLIHQDQTYPNPYQSQNTLLCNQTWKFQSKQLPQYLQK